MKKLIGILFLVSALASSAFAADITFAWDIPAGQTYDNVRLYEVSGASYVQKLQVAGAETTCTLTGVAVGNHTYIVRGILNAVESPDSNSAAKAIQPGAPGNFRIVAVNIAEDGTVTFKLLTPEEFFRPKVG